MVPIRHPLKAQSFTSMTMLFTMESFHAVSILLPNRLSKFQEWLHFFDPYYRTVVHKALFEFEGLFEKAR